MDPRVIRSQAVSILQGAPARHVIGQQFPGASGAPVAGACHAGEQRRQKGHSGGSEKATEPGWSRGDGGRSG